jgi:hypothetical protein
MDQIFRQQFHLQRIKRFPRFHKSPRISLSTWRFSPPNKHKRREQRHSN